MTGLDQLRHMILERVGPDTFKDASHCVAGYANRVPMIYADGRTYLHTPDGDLGIVTETAGRQVLDVIGPDGHSLGTESLPPLWPDAN